MTDRGRGMYGDADGARGVLSALGGDVCSFCEGSGEPCACNNGKPGQRARGTSTPEPRAKTVRGPYRGRCGNGAHPAQYLGHGESRVMVSPASEGCDGEVAAPEEGARNHLKLCPKCIAKYRAAMPVERQHEAALGRHEPMAGLCFHGLRPWQCAGTCFQ